MEKDNNLNLEENNNEVQSEKANRMDEFTFIKQEKTDTPKWYVVYTYSGYEDKVMTNLKKTVENNGLEDLIYDVQVPKEETIEVRNGNRKRVQKKLYPGYVMVKMLLTDQTWYIVRNTRGVTGFVGPGSKPIPLTDVEIRTMGIEDIRINLDVTVGQEVIIISGPFENFNGKVAEVNPEQQKVKVTIPIFGRDTLVELDFVQVKGV